MSELEQKPSDYQYPSPPLRETIKEDTVGAAGFIFQIILYGLILWGIGAFATSATNDSPPTYCDQRIC